MHRNSPVNKDIARETGRSFSNTLRFLAFGSGLICAAGGVLATPGPATDIEKRESATSRALALPSEPGLAFGLLGSLEVRTGKHRFQAQWNDLLERAEAEKARYGICAENGDACAGKLKAWRALIGELEGLPQQEQMKRVNRAVNRLVKYTGDGKAFGERDHWATPLESFERGGDCEDYAILKFLTLLELGFDSDQLRMTIVRDRRRGLMHAVLSVGMDGKTYILDNLNSYAVEHQHVLKYVPLYSANLDAQWVHIVTTQIRARFVSHVMGDDGKGGGRALAVSKADEKPAAPRKDRIALTGTYADSWT